MFKRSCLGGYAYIPYVQHFDIGNILVLNRIILYGIWQIFGENKQGAFAFFKLGNMQPARGSFCFSVDMLFAVAAWYTPVFFLK